MSTNEFTDLRTSRDLAPSYAQRIVSSPILEESRQRLELTEEEALGSTILAATVPNTPRLLHLSVASVNPSMAQALANTIPLVFFLGSRVALRLEHILKEVALG